MANKFRLPILENFSWQEAFINFISTDDGLIPSKGDRYVILIGAEGSFENKDNSIAWYDGSIWQFDFPKEGWRAYNKFDDKYYFWNGTQWTDELIIGDIVITGNIETPNSSIWNIKANAEKSLSITSENFDNDYLNFNTVDDEFVVSSDARFQFKGIVDIQNDINLETNAIAVDLKQDIAAALTFDTTSLAGLLSFDTTSGSEKVKIGNDLEIIGNLIVRGSQTILETSTLTVEDNLITLNKGGLANSSANSGIEFEEDGNITGYIKVDEDRSGFNFKAPGVPFIGNVDFTKTSRLTFNGDLTVSDESFINQDVRTTATPTFNGLNITDDIDFNTNPLNINLQESDENSLVFKTEDGYKLTFDTLNDQINISSKIFVDNKLTVKNTFELQNGAQVTNTDVGVLIFSDTIRNITLEQVRKSYDSRALYDTNLGLIVFDEESLDVIS